MNTTCRDWCRSTRCKGRRITSIRQPSFCSFFFQVDNLRKKIPPCVNKRSVIEEGDSRTGRYLQFRPVVLCFLGRRSGFFRSGCFHLHNSVFCNSWSSPWRITRNYSTATLHIHTKGNLTTSGGIFFSCLRRTWRRYCNERYLQCLSRK